MGVVLEMARRDPYRRQMRRARRAMRNRSDDPFQLVILGPDEPLGLIALAAAGRWAYRHRTAFAPFGIALAAFAVAAYAHPHHARYWLPAAAITVLVTVVLGIPHRLLWTRPAGKVTESALSRLWAACGIDRGIERAYAATVIAVTGGWLAAAIAAGPSARPLPAIAGIATMILAVPWWFHRRRRAKARVEKTISAWPEVAGNAGLAGSEILSVVVDAWGWTARVLLRKGKTTEQVIGKIPVLESNLGLRPGSMRVLADGKRADRFIMRVIENDPHAAPVPWPGPSVTSVTRPAEIGLTEDGRPVRVLLLRRNVLIGGIAGAGKSGILNVIIATLAACPDVVLWGVDLKGGMELRPWAACFGRLATTPDEATGLFRDAVGWLNYRARENAAEGIRLHEPAPDNPALVIITDEHAELPREAHECADSIARRGRAVAVNLIAATQRPTQTAMGKDTAVRSQMDVRICLRVREKRDVDLILGQGSVNAGWHAHQLTQPGEFLISDPEHTAPERNRAYLIDDQQVARHATRYAASRPRLPAGRPDTAPSAPGPAQADERPPARGNDYPAPETVLWDALNGAGPDGVSVADLEAACGRTRRWVYYRLREHAAAGRAVQVARGYWRAARPSDGPSGDGRPPPRPKPGRPPGRPRRSGRRRPATGDGDGE
jgi:DNA segregation ATPase FtsK/SpoIIIE, S-DNA-T family